MFIAKIAMVFLVSASSLWASEFTKSVESYFPSIEAESIKLNTNSGQYVSLSLDQHPVLEIKELIEKDDRRLVLKNRGEAHITIFNPNEWKSIKKRVTLEQLKDLATVKIKLRCLGRGVVGEKSTYFLIVNSPELLKLREDLVSSIESKDNIKLGFTPFRPHITVGFTHEDLHYENGVDKSICWDK